MDPLPFHRQQANERNERRENQGNLFSDGSFEFMSRTKYKVLCGVSPVVKCMFKCHISIYKYWFPYF